jgi:hypothetical protein
MLLHTDLVISKFFTTGDKVGYECRADFGAKKHPLFGITQDIQAILLANADVFQCSFLNGQELLTGN